MPRLARSTRLKILNEVFAGHKKVSSVCKKWAISRFTFYAWAKEYKQSGQLSDRTRRAAHHYKYISGNREKFILDLVLKNPTWTFAQFAGYLKIHRGGKFKTSVKGITNVLGRHNLKSKEDRITFSRTRPIKTLFAHKFSDFEKYKVIEEYLQGENKIARICRKYSISRFTFYAWLARYKESQTVSALATRRPKAEAHWKYIGEAVKQKVIDAVVSNPTYSVHKLHADLNSEEALRLRSGSSIGHHAIQNILARENLNKLDARLRFAQEYAGAPQAVVAPLYEVPVPRLSVWRLLFAPFKTVPKWIIKHPASWPIVLPTLAFIAYIFEVDKLFYPAFFFPLIALSFGFFFFLYSLKYYASLIIVMRVSQRGEGREEKKKGRIVSFLERYFKLGSARISRVDPLLLNLDKVQLEAEPFVSIHIAVYNEKKVIERLIEACKNQKWSNFEVILADDSTDETTEIAKKALSTGLRHLENTFRDESLEIFVSKPQKGEAGPIFKLIHRFSREGFKGAALQKALENSNPYADFIVVFDSDFVPYPDTIAQFVKTFQASCGGLERVKDSNLAAVQGYQWHVLNKSQNWVTRGVRTEYSGSYVIERAGIGIYGGLNMIAGSVFCIRADLLRAFAWGRSITEDFELTLRLYERGYKVLFTPYIQAPAEAVSTVRRLIRQRMRWAEGHTFNIRKMAQRILLSPYVNRREKSEFVYLAPYYLQAAFFIVGTIAWFLSEIVLKVRLPFWTAAWGWSLVFVNFLALPLMNLVGLFLEESEERDYLGIASFLVLSYILVPFTAYAAVKALFEPSEGPWFRTPKTGLVTDVFDRTHIYNWLEKLKIWGRPSAENKAIGNGELGNRQLGNRELGIRQWGLGISQSLMPSAYSPVPNPASSFNAFSGYSIKPKRVRFMARGALAVLLISVMFVNYLAFFAPQVKANHSANHLEQQQNIIDQTYSPNSTTYAPTDNSLGLVKWEATKFTSPTVYFEALISSSGAENIGQGLSIACQAATDCKISNYRQANTDLVFADCGDATCSSANVTENLLDGGPNCVLTSCSTNSAVGSYNSIACPTAAATDCKVAYAAGAQNLDFAACTAANCSTGTVTILDGPSCALTGCSTFSSPGTGQYSSINCPAATNCKIAYQGRGSTQANTLKFAACTAADCSTGNVNVLDGDTGCVLTGCGSNAFTYANEAMACPAATNCKIAYTKSNLPSFAACTAADCSTGSFTLALEGSVACPLTGCDTNSSLTTAGESIACPAATDTDCKLSYIDRTNGRLKFADCDAAVCSSGTVKILDGSSCVLTGCSTGDVIGTSVVWGNKNINCPAATNCKIAYYDSTQKSLRFAACTATDCSTGSVKVLDGSGCVLTGCSTSATVGQYSSIDCPAADDCKISYYDTTNGALKFADCDAADCSSGTVSTTDNGQVTATAGLHDSSGTLASCGAGNAEVSTTVTSYTRVRTSCSVTLTDGSNYTVRLKSDVSGITVNVKAARLIILQDPGTGNITATQTEVEVGSNTSTAINAYTVIINNKYCYDSTQTGTACSAASPSLWSPTPTVTLEATLRVATSTDTVYAELFDGTSELGPVTHTGDTIYALATATVTPVAGHEYYVRVKCVASGGGNCGSQANLANAKIVLDQSDATNGVTNLETVQQFINYVDAESASSYTTHVWDNQFTKSNFTAGTVNYYFEASLFIGSCGGKSQPACASAYAVLYDNTSAATIDTASPPSSEVKTAATAITRVRSGQIAASAMPSGGKNLTLQMKSSGGQNNVYVSWLIIQLSSLQVPEGIIFAAPLALFIPKAAKRIRVWWKKRRKAKAVGA